MSELDRRLATVAARQRQLVTLDDIAQAGGSRQNAHNRVIAGRYVRVERSVLLANGAPRSWETRLLATLLAAPPESLTSHLAGGRRYGLPGCASAGIEITTPRGRRFRRRGVRAHESRDLHLAQPRVLDGIPVTGPARTLLDLAGVVGDRLLLRMIEHARRTSLVTWTDLAEVLATHARRGRPGIRQLRRAVLANAHREEVTDTDMELLVLSLLREAGLPEPVVHHEVRDGDRFVAEIDLAYPPQKLALECDGDIHLRPEVRERDLVRQNDLVLLGWNVLRFSHKRVATRPGSVVREVRDALAGS